MSSTLTKGPRPKLPNEREEMKRATPCRSGPSSFSRTELWNQHLVDDVDDAVRHEGVGGDNPGTVHILVSVLEVDVNPIAIGHLHCVELSELLGRRLSGCNVVQQDVGQRVGSASKLTSVSSPSSAKAASVGAKTVNGPSLRSTSSR